MSKTILKYIIELLIVAFGVFLGMYVGDWKADQGAKKNAAKSINYIIAELENNHELLTKTVSYHDTIKINLRKITSTLSRKTIESNYFGNKSFHVTQIDKWTGIGLTKFETISFEGAKINGVLQEIEFEKVQLIAGIYKQITFTQDFGNTILDKFLQSNSTTTVGDVVGKVELLTTDYLGIETLLLQQLSQSIEQLKEYQL